MQQVHGLAVPHKYILTHLDFWNFGTKIPYFTIPMDIDRLTSMRNTAQFNSVLETEEGLLYWCECHSLVPTKRDGLWRLVVSRNLKGKVRIDS
ncbi:MAG: hypothetical protein KAV87_08035 [Desulfobacteraceae bacterium]|nr:hypothetical protein [Desulfobacteraceae bacterium]